MMSDSGMVRITGGFCMPVDDKQQTKGFCFVEFMTPQVQHCRHQLAPSLARGFQDVVMIRVIL